MSTFHTYMDQYKRRIHGNEGIKHPQFLTMQAVGNIATIIDECADQMPHQMYITQQDWKDTIKYILSGETRLERHPQIHPRW